MDPIEARLKVLRLAVSHHGKDEEGGAMDDEIILATAKSWGDFVVGTPVRESKRAGEGKGADAEAAAARGEPV